MLRRAGLRRAGITAKRTQGPGFARSGGQPREFVLRQDRGCDGCPVLILRHSDAWRLGKRVLCATCVYPYLRTPSGRPRRPARAHIRPVSKRRRADLVKRTALLLGLKDAVGHRCEYCQDPKCLPLDGHEVRKPRSLYWLDPEFVVILGRPHHEMAEAAFSSTTGRLVIAGTRSTGWDFTPIRGGDKFSVRAAALQAQEAATNA